MLTDGEIFLPLRQLKGEWVPVTDAFFFPEGQGGHFAEARFGDFRVLPMGVPCWWAWPIRMGNRCKHLLRQAAMDTQPH